MEDNLQRKKNFDGRWPLLEDNLQMEYNLQRKKLEFDTKDQVLFELVEILFILYIIK